MRFAHLSDSHLGTRQFGLMDRETDFYDVFAKNIDKIIEKDVDFVIHSGDLFDNNRPSTEALLAFQKALLRLNEEKIPIYAIAGNHDSILRKGAMPPLVLFKDLGLKVLSQDNPVYTEGPVLICGIPYVASSQALALKDFYAQLSKLADKYLKSILVSHQGIDKWMHEDTHEIELSEMPKNFDYYAMGHIHNYIEEDFGKGKLVYPGSMEIWRTSENNDNYREYGKGFVVVDLSYDTPEIERVKIDLPREFYNEIIDYNKFEERLPIIKKEIESLENKPMLDLTVVGGDFESSEVYEIIKETLGDSVLNLRPSFKPDKVLTEEESINPDNILDPRTLLHMKVNDKYGKDAGNLSINLLDNLSI
jgi:DNA repair exonuclease SbcCD nuclease subunit